MANFGLSELRLVNPRDGWPQERAWASASGADWPLNGARVFGRVEDAVADLQLVFATTARPRELQLPVLTPRQAAAERARRLAGGLGEAHAPGELHLAGGLAMRCAGHREKHGGQGSKPWTWTVGGAHGRNLR